MSKLKIAKAVQKFFPTAGMVLKWVAIAFAVTVVIGLLVAWANWHFASFAVVVGLVVAFFTLGGLVELWDWSKRTVQEAEQEERRAQERNRIEKARRENPGKYVPTFEGYDDPTDPHGLYR